MLSNRYPRIIALAGLLLTFVLGCEQKPGYEHTYTTRGVVMSLPSEKAYDEFIVHHEEIPGYVSINGSIGMNEMAMPIPVPDHSLLKGIAVGDKIELVFGERFEESEDGFTTSRMGVISIKKLDATVELNLSKTAFDTESQ